MRVFSAGGSPGASVRACAQAVSAAGARPSSADASDETIQRQSRRTRSAAPSRSGWPRERTRAVEDAKFRARQAHGKLRRFVNIHFRKEEVIEALALRRGDCNRCGACCEILFKCPFLKKHDDGTTTCGIYEDRPNQCRLFPIEHRDLEEVRGTCSFYFIEKPDQAGKS